MGGGVRARTKEGRQCGHSTGMDESITKWRGGSLHNPVGRVDFVGQGGEACTT